MKTVQGVQLYIKGTNNSDLQFTGLQLIEKVGAFIPTIVATFVVGTDFLEGELEYEDVELNLVYLDYINLTFLANVDKIEFNKNDLTIYFSVAPRNFYTTPKSESFTSIDEAINGLYWGENIVSEVTDSAPIEFNQVGTTDAKTLFRALSSLKSPSCFSLNLGRLKITDLSNPKPTIVIKPSDGTNYKLDKSGTTISKNKVNFLPHSINGAVEVEGNQRLNQVNWGSKSIFVNKGVEPLLLNMIENAKWYDRGRQVVRVNFMYLPEFMCGDVISITLPLLESTDYLVVERLAVMNQEVQVSALLKPLR